MSSEERDEDLVRRVVDGDRAAFGIIVGSSVSSRKELPVMTKA